MHITNPIRLVASVVTLAGSCLIATVGVVPGRLAVVRADEVTRLATADADSSLEPLDPREVNFDEIVFVKRKPYSSDHYYTDINNGTSPDRFLPDNGIYIYNLRTRIGASRGHGRRSARRARLHRQDQPVVRRPQKVVVRFSPGSRLRFSHLGGEHRRHAACGRSRSRRRTRRRRWPAGARPGTPTTSIRAICRTARSSSPRRAASTRCSAAGRPTWWPRVCTAWMPTARTSNSSPAARSANSARWFSTTAASCITAGSTSTRAPASARRSGP